MLRMLEKKEKSDYASVMLVTAPIRLQNSEHKRYVHGIKLYQVLGTRIYAGSMQRDKTGLDADG